MRHTINNIPLTTVPNIENNYFLIIRFVSFFFKNPAQIRLRYVVQKSTNLKNDIDYFTQIQRCYYLNLINARRDILLRL